MGFMIDWIGLGSLIQSNKSQNASFLSLASAIASSQLLPANVLSGHDRQHILFLPFGSVQAAYWYISSTYYTSFLQLIKRPGFIIKIRPSFWKAYPGVPYTQMGHWWTKKRRKAQNLFFFLGLRTWPDPLSLTHIFTKVYVPHKMILTFSHHIPSIFVLSCSELRYKLKSLCAIKFYNIFITPTN